jgi:nucleotide-binding universal stress UspA family protein
MIDSQSDSGPVIVGVDGSERSVEALALADLLGLALGRRVVITHVHPFRQLSSLFAEGEYERLEREVAESTFEQIREYLPSVPERRLQLVAGDSPAAGLHALAEAEGATLIVVGSSHRSAIGRILVGGTGDRLLSGASAPVAVAPAGYATAAAGIQTVACGFDRSQESHRALAWAAELARTTSARLRVSASTSPPCRSPSRSAAAGSRRRPSTKSCAGSVTRSSPRGCRRSTRTSTRRARCWMASPESC